MRTFALVTAAVLVAWSAAYAQDQKAPDEAPPAQQKMPMMKGGMGMMKQMSQMMEQMGQMMENCNKMMESHLQERQQPPQNR